DYLSAFLHSPLTHIVRGPRNALILRRVLCHGSGSALSATGNHIEHVRTDVGCRGEALTRWQL
ncbi:hypothetical protein, partial [Escherichia coli]|uniref:hypothetical protein n=1 Tax=Escherichia coli TaxID=562 RepID=UPI003D6D40BB